MSSTPEDWMEYIKSMKRGDSPSDFAECYLDAISDGESFGFFSEPTYNKALAMFHTWASKELGITREEFASLVAMEKLGRFVEIGDEFLSIKVKENSVKIIGRMITSTSSGRMDKPHPPCPQPDWREPYEGALEDLPRGFTPLTVQNGTYHTSIWLSGAEFDIKFLPAFVDALILRGAK